jgi:hypothetical protein
LQVVPNPVASFILSEVRNIVVTARHLAFAALITAICSSSMLVILGGFAKTAALDVAKQVGGGQACIQVAAKGLEYGYKYPAALILILLVGLCFHSTNSKRRRSSHHSSHVRLSR